MLTADQKYVKDACGDIYSKVTNASTSIASVSSDIDAVIARLQGMEGGSKELEVIARLQALKAALSFNPAAELQRLGDMYSMAFDLDQLQN